MFLRHTVGHCKIGRPIIYSCNALANNRVYEDNREHLIHCFEMAVKCMPDGVESWIWICDFHGAQPFFGCSGSWVWVYLLPMLTLL